VVTRKDGGQVMLGRKARNVGKEQIIIGGVLTDVEGPTLAAFGSCE